MKKAMLLAMAIMMIVHSARADSLFGNALYLRNIAYLWGEDEFGDSILVPDTSTVNYARAADTKALYCEDALTVEAWVCPLTLGERQLYSIVANDEYEIHVSGIGTMYAWENVAGPLYGAAELTAGQWYHVAYVHDGANANVYVNGEVDISYSNARPLNEVDQVLWIGTDCCGPGRQFHGFIDELRIWNIARTPSQIVENMNDTLGPSIYNDASSGLIAYYRFDRFENLNIGFDSSGSKVSDGLTDDIRDLSVHQNHADVAGDTGLVLHGTTTDPNPVSVIGRQGPSVYFQQGMQLWPSLFKRSTSIHYFVSRAGWIRLGIYDQAGRHVRTLANRESDAGNHSVVWNHKDARGRLVSNGVYFCSLKVRENACIIGKMIMAK